ncbi:MAG: hypothetical protein AAGD00_09460 [Planctomycetota bacterium]
MSDTHTNDVPLNTASIDAIDRRFSGSQAPSRSPHDRALSDLLSLLDVPTSQVTRGRQSRIETVAARVASPDKHLAGSLAECSTCVPLSQADRAAIDAWATGNAPQPDTLAPLAAMPSVTEGREQRIESTLAWLQAAIDAEETSRRVIAGDSHSSGGWWTGLVRIAAVLLLGCAVLWPLLERSDVREQPLANLSGSSQSLPIEPMPGAFDTQTATFGDLFDAVWGTGNSPSNAPSPSASSSEVAVPVYLILDPITVSGDTAPSDARSFDRLIP